MLNVPGHIIPTENPQTAQVIISITTQNTFFMQGIDRGSQKYDSIKYRNDRPDACKDFPVFYSKSAEENRRDQYHSHMSPTLNGLVLNLNAIVNFYIFLVDIIFSFF